MSYKIEKRDGLEIYAGDTGLVVLKQEDGLGRDESGIFIHPDDVPRVIEYLTSTAENAREIREDIAKEAEETSQA